MKNINKLSTPITNQSKAGIGKEPKISVLTPAYNAKTSIEDAVKSILNQTYKNFEYIIIDDASKDDTYNKIIDLAQKDSRIKVYRNKTNQGIPATRNILISKATGKYIVWQDADDISLKERIEKQVDFMEKNPDIGISGAYLQFFTEKDGDLLIREYDPNDLELRKNLFKYSPVSQGTAIIRKDILDKAGLYDLRLTQAEDLDMSFRLGKYSKFANLQEVLLRCRFHEKSESSSKLKENIRLTLLVRQRAVKQYGYKMGLFDRLAFTITYMIQLLPAKIVFRIFNILRNIF
ncbi:glycosyltransferase family 2 protein [Candidatus Dojkabacteria bacterium]|nr:glycosyltransferase family 2 protein [Candidatus Dojkabacteria bacterium]